MIKSATALIADILCDGQVKVHVIHPSTLDTAPSSTDALQEDLVAHLQKDDDVHRPSNRGKSLRKRFRLYHCPGKSVEDDPSIVRRSLQSLFNQCHYQLVWYQVPFIHEYLSLPTQLGPLTACRTKEVTGSEVLPPKGVRKECPLGSLPDAGWP